jgi:hypothetical protein
LPFVDAATSEQNMKGHVAPVLRGVRAVVGKALKPLVARCGGLQHGNAARTKPKTFPAVGLRSPKPMRNVGVFGAKTDLSNPGPYLSRIQSEGFELLAPFRWGVAKSLHSNTAWQTTFDRSAHEIRC